jgi:hypothetical protein
MRIAGWVLLLAGFVLCLSVAWAALGFLLMGFGLVSLQAGERKRRKAEKAAAVAAARPGARPAPAPAVAEAPPAHAEEVADAPQRPPVAEAQPPADSSAYDREAWRRLIESDPDLAQLAAVLSDYGQHHVDEFASSYLAKPDKGRLATIVNEIIAKAARTQSAPVAAPADVPRPSIAADQQPTSPDARPEPNRRVAKIHAPKIAVAPPAERSATAPRIQSASAIRLEPTPEHENKTITSAEDDFSELIRKFANDASFLRK